MHKLLKIFSALCFSLVLSFSNAQFTKSNDDPDAAFKLAKELFQKEKYSLAYPEFKYLYNNSIKNTNFPTTIQLEAKYYYIICGLKLNDVAAEQKAIDFIALEHHSPRIQMMSFYLAEYYFRLQNFGDAITYYSIAGIDNLTNAEIATSKFHKGYSYFSLQHFAEAKPLFDVVRQMPKDSNYIDANYYYGFISFSEKKYSDALKSFNIALASADYKNILPFYIAEIYYFDGEHEKALEYAEKYIKEGNQYYDLQLKQLAGHLWFDKKEYTLAQPYLETFVQHNDKVRREDLYELSYCYYAGGFYDKSIEGFKQIGGREDSLAQNSMYLLANAYLKTNQKSNARNAFLFCASNNSNPTQKEISSFSYAKLSYELDFTDIALKALQNFIGHYPNSPYIVDSKELEISLLANTSNYKDALMLFDSLPSQSENVKKVYPRILYGRAVELINDQRIVLADELLTKLQQVSYNSSLLQLVYFWRGEIAYRNGNMDDAVTYFLNYLKNPQVNGEVNGLNAKFSLAYSLLKKGNYTAALTYFLQVTPNLTNHSSAIEQDAYIRAADCYYMSKSYKQALNMYENVIGLNIKGADYALYQKAIIAGASNRNSDKIYLLQSLAKQYPTSNLLSEGNLEIANTYLADEKYNEAIIPLSAILKDKSATAIWPQAFLKMGVANFNLSKNEESLSNFTQLVANYPNSLESDEAIEYIRNIFISNQKPGDFINFMKQSGKPITYLEQDSLTYRSAQLQYDAKDFENAKHGFADYITQFSDGKYAIEANYFLAEILVINKELVAAIPYYTAVAAKAPNKFAERSVLQTARIYYFNLKDYTKAEAYFSQLKSLSTQQENKLEAMRGLLRCQYKLQQWKEAVANAQDLLQEKGIATDDKMMANMSIAKNYQSVQQLDMATNFFKQVITAGKSEFSAEAQYHLSEILMQQDKLAEAEKAAFEVIKKYGSYEYWVAKSYIALGDIYLKQNDLFNAEATFKSVVENASIDELKKEAQVKLDQVLELKKATNKVEQQ